MLPTLSCTNQPNGVALQSVFGCNGFEFSGFKIFGTYLLSYFFGNLGKARNFRASDCFPSMAGVFLQCYVLKVFQTVICSVAVFVVYLMTFGAWAYKSRHNFPVHLHGFLSNRVMLNGYKFVKVFIGSLFANDVTRFARAFNLTKRADLVKRFPANNWCPKFIHVQSPLIEKLRMKVHGNRYGKRLSGATLAMQGEFYYA